jgi:phage terminase small subunit
MQRGRRGILKRLAVNPTLAARPEPPASLAEPERSLWRTITREANPEMLFAADGVELLTEVVAARKIWREANERIAQDGMWVEDARGRREHLLLDVRWRAIRRYTKVLRRLRILTPRARERAHEVNHERTVSNCPPRIVAR